MRNVGYAMSVEDASWVTPMTEEYQALREQENQSLGLRPLQRKLGRQSQVVLGCSRIRVEQEGPSW
jgi:hypothetical protein